MFTWDDVITYKGLVLLINTCNNPILNWSFLLDTYTLWPYSIIQIICIKNNFKKL